MSSLGYIKFKKIFVVNYCGIIIFKNLLLRRWTQFSDIFINITTEELTSQSNNWKEYKLWLIRKGMPIFGFWNTTGVWLSYKVTKTCLYLHILVIEIHVVNVLHHLSPALRANVNHVNGMLKCRKPVRFT